MMRVNYAGLTDVGRVRGQNEDRWFADATQGLYLVADGIGGAAVGGLASQVVAEVLPRLLRQKLRSSKQSGEPHDLEQVQTAIAELSERLRKESKTRPGMAGMGSTVVLALVRDWRAIIAHMGDSRAYLFHEGHLERLTRDHTLAQLLVDSGDITPEEASSHPARGQLTRFVGMWPQLLPETRAVPLVCGDRLVLCSDGLTAAIGDTDLLALLGQYPVPEDACRRLVAAANEAGGKDNITVVVLAISDDSDELLPKA
jgi:protein phosphatase